MARASSFKACPNAGEGAAPRSAASHRGARERDALAERFAARAQRALQRRQARARVRAAPHGHERRRSLHQVSFSRRAGAARRSHTPLMWFCPARHPVGIWPTRSSGKRSGARCSSARSTRRRRLSPLRPSTSRRRRTRTTPRTTRPTSCCAARKRPTRPSSAPAHLRHATAARSESPPPPWPTRAWVPAGAWTATAPRRVTSRPTSARAKPPPAPARRARPTSAPPRSPSKAAAVDVAAAEEGVGAPDVRPGLA